MSTQRDAYTAFQEGTRLLEGGNVHAAVISLEEARALEPSKGSVREALRARLLPQRPVFRRGV